MTIGAFSRFAFNNSAFLVDSVVAVASQDATNSIFWDLYYDRRRKKKRQHEEGLAAAVARAVAEAKRNAAALLKASPSLLLGPTFDVPALPVDYGLAKAAAAAVAAAQARSRAAEEAERQGAEAAEAKRLAAERAAEERGLAEDRLRAVIRQAAIAKFRAEITAERQRVERKTQARKVLAARPVPKPVARPKKTTEPQAGCAG